MRIDEATGPTSPATTGSPPARSTTRRSAPLGGTEGRTRSVFVLPALLASAVALVALLLPITAVGAAPPNETQCNGIDNGGGLAVECYVTVVNNLDQATGAASSTVTTVVCRGAADGPNQVFPNPQSNPSCARTVTTYAALIRAVTQCNGSGALGGSVRCSVDITNNVTGSGTVAAATVNQCIGSGGGGGALPTDCDPADASTTSATVTQCNGSGNGGGSTGRVRCTVPGGSTVTSALPVTIDQCNGSANLGGSFVTCTASIRSIVTAAAVTPTTSTTTPTTTPTTTSTTTPTTTTAPGPTATTTTTAPSPGSTTSTTAAPGSTTSTLPGSTTTTTAAVVGATTTTSPAALTSRTTTTAPRAGGPGRTTTTAASRRPPTTSRTPGLPVTGSDTTLPLAGGAMLALGIVLVGVNRHRSQRTDT